MRNIEDESFKVTGLQHVLKSVISCNYMLFTSRLYTTFFSCLEQLQSRFKRPVAVVHSIAKGFEDKILGPQYIIIFCASGAIQSIKLSYHRRALLGFENIRICPQKIQRS